MTGAARPIRRLGRDDRGVTLPEFGLICLPLVTLLLGGLDLGYQLYVRAVMQGAVQNAARLTTVLTDSTLTNESTITTTLANQVRSILPQGVEPVVTRGSYYSFSSMNSMEPMTSDYNSNGQVDAPIKTPLGIITQQDCWTDYDQNGVRNIVSPGADGGADSVGAADDIVRYSVRVTYRRLSPIARMVPGMSDTVNLSATSIARRQPYKMQATLKSLERCRTT